MLYCIVGASGTGKSTIVNELIKLGYKSPDSYTTRPKRHEKETGHTFITDEEYDKLENIVAHTVFNNHRYCVTKDMLDGCDLYIVDVAGVKTLKENYDNFKVIGLYLDEEECRNRMSARGDSDDNIESRLENDRKMFAGMDEICDYKINVNNTLESVVNEILNIIKK